jgi:amino-acid N-acetyltransferase
LNPTKLDWRRFTVAMQDETLIGAVQIRHHRDGSKELGSLVVAPACRGQGISAGLIDAALAPVAEAVWMITRRAHIDHYARWGFLPSRPRQAPRSVRMNFRIGRAARVLSWLKGLEPTNLTLLVRQSSEGHVRNRMSDSAPSPIPAGLSENYRVGTGTSPR